MHKRILSMVLALTIVSSSFSFVSAARDIKGHWAEDNIRYLMTEDIIHGGTDGRFRPEDPITRAEFIKIVNGALGLTQKGQANFKDICEDCWFYDDILIARQANYVEGYDDNTVKPNDNISREQASTMLGRALKVAQLHSSSNNFRDSNRISSWAKGYVNAISNLGYISGYPSGEFKPQSNLKRAEAATILAKIMDNSKIEPPKAIDTSSAYEKEVHRLVNIERQKAGLKPLSLSSQISRVARDKSKDMAYGNYFSHTSPTFGSPFDMMKAYGIQFTAAAENIAAGHRSPEAVMRGWMNSTGHRNNILNSRYNKIGIGYHEFNGKTYWTQMFTN